MARARAWSSPWPTTRISVIVSLAVAVAASIFAALAQDRWNGWHFIGHSLSLWIIIATFAAMRGTFAQSWVTTSATLAVSVTTYYTVTRLFGPFDSYSPLAPLLVFWGALAIAGGFGFAVLCLTALGPGRFRFLAAGTIAGLMLGDAINTTIGLPYLEQPDPIAALGSISYSDPVFTVAIVGAACWTALILIRHRHRLLAAWSILPGLVAGHILVSIPDFLLHYS